MQVRKGGLVLWWELGFLLQLGFSLCVVVVVDVYSRAVGLQGRRTDMSHHPCHLILGFQNSVARLLALAVASVFGRCG